MNERNKPEFKEYMRCAADKSSVWQHFLRTSDGLQAQCKMCKKIFKTSGTTSSLHNHLRLVHSIQLSKKTNQPLPSTSQLQAASTSSISNSDASMTPATKRAKTINDFFQVKDEDDFDTMLAKMTAVDGVPFKIFCSSETMRKLFGKAGYKDLPKSPNTIKKRVLNKSELLKKEVKKELDDIKTAGKKLAVSLDEWTSARNRRYVNVNVHSPELSEGFRNLGLTKISGRGTSSNCYDILKEKLSYYGLSIDDDISCMVSDGASVMCALGRMMPSYHQLCLAHGIQCAVLDVLYKADNTAEDNTCISIGRSEDSSEEDSDSDIDNENENGFVIETDHRGRIPKLVYKDLITKVRKIVRYLKCSPTRMDLFNLYLELESKNKDSTLILDCKTRWSSLADMVSRFLQFKDAIQKTLIDLKENTTFSDAEILILNDLSSSLNIIKATVEQICERKSNLLSAEIALQFMMENLALKPDRISSQLIEALNRRVLQRRNTKLISTLKYLHNPTKYYEERDAYAFPKASNTEIFASIVKINEMYFCTDKITTSTEFETEDELPLGAIVRQRLENEREQASKTFKDQLKTKIYESLQGAAEVSTKNLAVNNDLETSVRVEMALLDQGGPKSIHLQRVYDFLLTIPPTSVEAERVFSANRFFCHHLRSSMNDDTLDALSFLRSYFLNTRK